MYELAFVFRGRPTAIHESPTAKTMPTSEELRTQLDALKKDGEKLAEDVAAAEKEQQAAADRADKIAKLDADIAASTERAAASKQRTAEMEELLADFPTETQVLKLERRVESLKDQVNESDKVAEQHRTGVEAYTVRRDACLVARVDLTAQIEQAIKDAFDAAEKSAARDGQLQTEEAITASIEELCTIANDREAELTELNQQITDKTREEEEVTAQIAGLNQKVEQALPALEADSERHIAAITNAWAAERGALQGVYDKLFAVNKEQQYHLMRGTHIKRAAAPLTIEHEKALSSRHDHLSAQLVDVQRRLQFVKGENYHTRKEMETVRLSGRAQVEESEASKAEMEERLAEVHEECAALDDEAQRARALKLDLQQALQSIREAPGKGNATPR
jgi:chromosome segregation ATPase